MSLGPLDQISQLVRDKKRFLITFKKHFDGDALASALATKLILESLGKKVDIVCDRFVLPAQYTFLRNANKVKSHIGDLHQFIVSLDIEKTGVSELSYDVLDDKLRIFITPKTGYITKEALSTAQTEFKYDCIIVLDTPDLLSLADIHANHEDFFYSVPTINIDHKSSNEHFGTVNYIDQPASSTSEMMYTILTHIAEEHFDRTIAQILLTGLIAGTTGFRHKKVRPQTLHIASKLSDLGADRAYIMKRLFQTKSIGTFRIWGAALANLQHDPTHNIVWTTITRDDFKRNNASVHDVYAIIDELITTSPDAQYILVLYEDPQSPEDHPHVQGLLRIIPSKHAAEVMKKYHAVGDEDAATFTIKDSSLTHASRELVDHLRSVIMQ